MTFDQIANLLHYGPGPGVLICYLLGAVGLCIVVFAAVLTPRARWAGGDGRERMTVHVCAGLLSLGIVLLHSGLQFQGMAGVALALLMAVAVSGMVGRYLVRHSATTQRELEREVETLEGELTEQWGGRLASSAAEEALRELLRRDVFPPAPAEANFFGAVIHLLRLDFALAGRERWLRRQWRVLNADGGHVELFSLAMRYLDRVATSVAMTTVRRAMRGWRSLHRPLLGAMMAAVVLHILAVWWF